MRHSYKGYKVLFTKLKSNDIAHLPKLYFILSPKAVLFPLFLALYWVSQRLFK